MNEDGMQKLIFIVCTLLKSQEESDILTFFEASIFL